MKRIKVYHLRETFCPRALLVDDKSPMPDHESFLIPVEDHERIVAELKAEIVRLELVAMAAAESIKEKYKIMDMQKRVIEKLKRYTQHRVECVYRTGVFQYSNDCDCGLKAIEKGEA